MQYFSCFVRWFALTSFLMAMWRLIFHPDIPGAVSYFIDLSVTVIWWRDYALRTYRYRLEIYRDNGTVVERKFLSLQQRNRIVGALVEAGGYKMED